jgi:hypothetical protein
VNEGELAGGLVRAGKGEGETLSFRVEMNRQGKRIWAFDCFGLWVLVSPLEVTICGGASHRLCPVELIRGHRVRHARTIPDCSIEKITLQFSKHNFTSMLTSSFLKCYILCCITSEFLRFWNEEDKGDFTELFASTSFLLGLSTSSCRGFFPESIFLQLTSIGVDTFVSTPLCHTTEEGSCLYAKACLSWVGD